MRRAVANKTDLDPEEAGYRDNITLLLNEAHEAVWSECVWDFAQKIDTLAMYPDLDHSRTASQATTQDGSRVVTFDVAIPILTFKADIWEGNVIELHGREYTILQVNSTTELVTTEAIRHPAVGTPAATPATLTEQQDWRIKARFYTLPEDCVQILSLAHRDAPIPGSSTLGSGKVWGMGNRIEEIAGLEQDRTATSAQAYVPIPPTVVPPAEKLSITWVQNLFAGDGSFPSDEYWEFCWCFMAPDGTLGPLSEPAAARVPFDDVADFSATLSFLSFDGQPMRARAPSYATRGNPEPLEGLRKRVFFNANYDHATGERLGEPKWLEVVEGTEVLDATVANANEPITALDVAPTVSIRFRDGCVPGNKPYREWDGSHKRVRPWPRVDAWDQRYTDITATTGRLASGEDYFRRAELRYLTKPDRLRYDTDTPALPWQMHRLIVDMALVQIFLKSGNAALASYYEKLAEKQMAKFKARYLAKEDFTWRRGRFGTVSHGIAQMQRYRVTKES